MLRLTLIWGALLLAGVFMAGIHAQVAVTAASYKATPINNSTTAPTTSNTTHLTTKAPTNTTSHTTSNTTKQPIPTTTPALPTRPSPPTRGRYVVNNTNGTCIIADMGLELELDNATVMQAKESKGKQYFNVNPKMTSIQGTCGESRANLQVVFPEGFISFAFLKESKQYHIEEISVNFTWNSAEHWNGTSGTLKLLSTYNGYSVKCTRTPTVNLTGNIILSMADVKLQAFEIHDNNFGKEELCFEDRNTIAVAIGVTVIILIIIAIIIYFICHKRRSSAYQRI